MNVSQLIARLSVLPATAEVHLNTHSDWQYVDCDEVALREDGVVEISAIDPDADDEED